MVTQDYLTQSRLLNQMDNNANKNTPIGDISLRLREERKRLGLNQSAFADAMSITLTSYVRYEQGKRSIPSDKLLLLELSGADAAFILTGKRAHPEEGFIEQRFARLKQSQQQVIQELINLFEEH